MGERLRKLLVGLGNPGPEYRATRHNMGFMVADEFASRNGIVISGRKFEALFGKGLIEGVEVMIVKPLTYMNLSGRSVGRMADFFQIKGEDVLVVHDDMDLPFGRIRVKEKGGHAGHNGLKSIMESLGGGGFARIRVGIGRPPHAATDHVLGGFTSSERGLLPDIVGMAAEAADGKTYTLPVQHDSSLVDEAVDRAELAVPEVDELGPVLSVVVGRQLTHEIEVLRTIEQPRVEVEGSRIPRLAVVLEVGADSEHEPLPVILRHHGPGRQKK